MQRFVVILGEAKANQTEVRGSAAPQKKRPLEFVNGLPGRRAERLPASLALVSTPLSPLVV
jgi:hypothetical protein